MGTVPEGPDVDLNALSEEYRQQLVAQGWLPANPILLEPYQGSRDERLEQFKQSGINFAYVFGSGMLAEIKQTQPCYKRFEYLYPHTVHVLRGKFAAAKDHFQVGAIFKENVDEYFEAFKLMSELVDESDEYVVNSEGVPEKGYLL